MTEVLRLEDLPQRSRVYVAGRMTGLPDFNFPAFDDEARALHGYGYEPVNPADLDRDTGFDPTGMTGNEDMGPEFRAGCARRDLDALLGVDAVVTLEDWEQSTGAKNEVMIARWLGLPVFDCHWDLMQPSTAPFAGDAKVAEKRAFREAEDRFRMNLDPEAFHRRNLMAKASAFSDEARRELAGEIEFVDDDEWHEMDCGVAGGLPHSATACKEDPPPTFAKKLPLYAEPRVVDPENEVRIVDPDTGGAKGAKPQRMELLPYDVLLALSEHYAKGADKYGERNFELGYAYSLSMAALMRHLAAWWQGEDVDAETGSNHMFAVIFHAINLAMFQLRGIGTDDRPLRTNDAAA